MQDYFKCSKEIFEKSLKPPDLHIEYLVLVSTLNFNKIKGPNELNDLFAGPFMIRLLNGPNAIKLELTCELMKKHPTFPVIMINPYRSNDRKLFPLRNKPPLEIMPLKEGEEKKIVKVLKETRKRNKKVWKYLVRYRNPAQGDEFLLESDIPNSDKILRRIRNVGRHKE
ncbi:hypothetical protein O181_001661 [Austropuccinia psidii MF-1]|uniref:Uncharacterized protein n=1 Tax=Austropuccinia psidii MF-1 TaxID=1389203 RepID=A0A9Q3BBF5_9BASI|nr:hypothetical protein [Austropuccinia psidii MF-1]